MLESDRDTLANVLPELRCSGLSVLIDFSRRKHGRMRINLISAIVIGIEVKTTAQQKNVSRLEIIMRRTQQIM